jgi:hypothetical protein
LATFWILTSGGEMASGRVLRIDGDRATHHLDPGRFARAELIF